MRYPQGQAATIEPHKVKSDAGIVVLPCTNEPVHRGIQVSTLSPPRHELLCEYVHFNMKKHEIFHRFHSRAQLETLVDTSAGRILKLSSPEQA